MSDLFIWINSGEGGVKFMKRVKGDENCKKFGNLCYSVSKEHLMGPSMFVCRSISRM
jgi:hypothetical protein